MSIRYRFEPAPKPLYKVIILLLFKRSKTRDWNKNTTQKQQQEEEEERIYPPKYHLQAIALYHTIVLAS